MIFLVVMVTGGQKKGNAPLTSVELLSTEGARLCSLPDLPKARKHHSQTGLVACAGYGDRRDKDTLKSCVTLKSGRWQKSHTLRKPVKKKWKIPHLGGLDQVIFHTFGCESSPISRNVR